MKRLLVLLLLASPAYGQSVKVPAEVRVDPKEWAVVTFEADGGPTRWMMPDKGLEEVPLASLLGEHAEKAKCRIFKARAPGRYRVWVVTAKAREADPKIADVSVPAECVVVVGESPEPPPVPPGPTPPGPAPAGTAATYVYEKDQHAIPNQVLSALNRLNRERRIVATAIEADTKDGTGEIPEQYKVPLEAAKKAGLPALVVTANGKVLSVVKDPKTEQAVLEAVK